MFLFFDYDSHGDPKKTDSIWATVISAISLVSVDFLKQFLHSYSQK